MAKKTSTDLFCFSVSFIYKCPNCRNEKLLVIGTNYKVPVKHYCRCGYAFKYRLFKRYTKDGFELKFRVKQIKGKRKRSE